jgi:hypothetical protein
MNKSACDILDVEKVPELAAVRALSALTTK